MPLERPSRVGLGQRALRWTAAAGAGLAGRVAAARPRGPYLLGPHGPTALHTYLGSTASRVRGMPSYRCIRASSSPSVSSTRLAAAVLVEVLPPVSRLPRVTAARCRSCSGSCSECPRGGSAHNAPRRRGEVSVMLCSPNAAAGRSHGAQACRWSWTMPLAARCARVVDVCVVYVIGPCVDSSSRAQPSCML